MSVTPTPGPFVRPLVAFGAELRKRRKAAGLSQDRLAEITQFSQSLIGFIERGERTPSRNFAQRCDDALEAGGEVIRLWEHITRGASPRWFRGWLDVEPAAHTLHTWQPLVVPGLLQTEAYARAVIRGEPGTEPIVSFGTCWVAVGDRVPAGACWGYGEKRSQSDVRGEGFRPPVAGGGHVTGSGGRGAGGGP
ncbi:Scr1 family TA system antitoxin-like transcriptional regulator [Streptosporangium sp. NBC_01755]|uniref:helix-turn-helix domain-containing protein n=1 Tax=Streptosporangium sp. NBC_01755 TaxID=2975949 RepID=UPI003FA379C0